jgi:hypothetical protein
MLWMPSAIYGNRQKRKWPVVVCKALQWVKTNSAPPPPQGSH